MTVKHAGLAVLVYMGVLISIILFIVVVIGILFALSALLVLAMDHPDLFYVLALGGMILYGAGVITATLLQEPGEPTGQAADSVVESET